MAILKKSSNPLIPRDAALIKCHSDLTPVTQLTAEVQLDSKRTVNQLVNNLALPLRGKSNGH